MHMHRKPRYLLVTEQQMTSIATCYHVHRHPHFLHSHHELYE